MEIERSAGGIIVRADRVLIVYQNSTRTWAFPKGHVNERESELTAARREILEETGISKLRNLGKLGAYTRGTHRQRGITKHIAMFLFVTKEDVARPRLGDVRCCEWVTPGEARQRLSYPEDAAFFERVQSAISALLERCRA
ncbi:MAG: NUDIX domain-containing protein [Deltaproteobacteria bacterium]|nr:NUDIX domain-containing protein [Deltaproteobacteria bacterium]